jgi:hypothetical protein
VAVSPQLRLMKPNQEGGNRYDFVSAAPQHLHAHNLNILCDSNVYLHNSTEHLLRNFPQEIVVTDIG